MSLSTYLDTILRVYPNLAAEDFRQGFIVIHSNGFTLASLRSNASTEDVLVDFLKFAHEALSSSDINVLDEFRSTMGADEVFEYVGGGSIFDDTPKIILDLRTKSVRLSPPSEPAWMFLSHISRLQLIPEQDLPNLVPILQDAIEGSRKVMREAYRAAEHQVVIAP